MPPALFFGGYMLSLRIEIDRPAYKDRLPVTNSEAVGVTLEGAIDWLTGSIWVVIEGPTGLKIEGYLRDLLRLNNSDYSVR